MILLHVKQKQTKLSKNCHPHSTRFKSVDISYGRQFEWWDEQNQRSYDNHVKPNIYTSTWYTPRKCWSRSQQRSSQGLRLRLTALLVSIERVWWISHSLIASSALDTWQSTFRTHVVEEVAGPRDIFEAVSQPDFHAVSSNSSLSILLNHYRTLRTKQRRWS